MQLFDGHVAALVGLVQVRHEREGRQRAAELLGEELHGLLLGGIALDGQDLERATTRLETLVVMTNEELVLAEIARVAMLDSIDSEVDLLRRGLRYFFAATLDARLGDYTAANGHAVLAEDEFASVDRMPPFDIRRFIEQLEG